MTSSGRPSDPSHDLKGVRLASFVLARRIGVGGMSEVWAGHDSETATDVAVKLLFESPRRRDEARRRARTDALFKELHALARLDHPGILPLLDFGTIDAAVEVQTNAALLAGSPYLVTPLVFGGSLDNAPEPQSFEELAALLSALAAALGHAHARGVVHRDLKPGNVLLDIDADGTVRPVLSDFGISFAREEGPDAPSRAGTPSSMAPEQIRGVRDQGPATDLYALGCVAYRLASGRAPFVGATDDVLRAHLLSAPPELVPLFDVPRAFEDWLNVLLEKRPAARFPSARAAAHALQSLPRRPLISVFTPELEAPVGEGSRDASARRREEPTLPARTSNNTTAVSVRPAPIPDDTVVVTPAGDRLVRASLFPPAPADADWRSLEGSGSRFGTTTGSGLALFGLRSVPLTGRDAARDRLFTALATVARTKAPRVVLVTGPLGVGATRLCEWMLETAAELDQAVIARTSCATSSQRGDALIVLLERLVRARGISGEERRDQVRAWLDDVTRHAPDGRDEADLLALFSRDTKRLDQSGPRHAALRRLLGRAAPRKPLLVLIDDASSDGEVVAFIRSLAQVTEGLPVLLLATATDEALDANPVAAEVLRRVAEGPTGEHLGLGPLDPREVEALATGPLALGPELAHVVAERSLGHPLFVIQLVSDWVSRGVLLRGIDGGRLREGTSLGLPDGIHTVFGARLQGLWEAVRARSSAADADRALVALELVAVLGETPEPDAWLALCEARGAWANEDALRLPEARGLIRWRTGRFDLAHPLLRESLERRAAEAGRLAGHHAAVADLLEEAGSEPRRIAMHRLAAGQTERALAPLLAGAERLTERSDLLGAHELLDRYEAALVAVGGTPSDARRLPLLVGRAEAFAQAAYLDQADQAIVEASAIARTPPERAAVAQLRGVLLGRRGSTALSVGAFEEALALLGDGAPLSKIALRSRYGIAEARKLTGDFRAAEDEYRSVLSGTSPDERMHAMALVGLSDAASRAGRPDEALVYGEEALRRLEQKGYWHAVAVTHNSLGDLERRRDRLREADAHYRESLEIMLVIGSADAAIVRLNLALIAIARGDFEDADATLAVARTGLEGRDRDLYVRMCDTMRLPTAIVRGDRPAAEQLAEVAKIACATVADPDVAYVLDRAADLARAAGWADFAEALATLADSQRARV